MIIVYALKCNLLLNICITINLQGVIREQHLLDNSGNYSVVNGNVSHSMDDDDGKDDSYDHGTYGNMSVNGEEEEENASPADVSGEYNDNDNAHDDSGSSGIAVDNSLDSVAHEEDEPPTPSGSSDGLNQPQN